MPAANGGAWPACHSASEMPVPGMLECESPGETPWPGKCLSVDSTWPCSPVTAAATRAAASSGVPPIERS